ncbi:hypothetical protein MRX96_000568 [Rhipicephalus microplus]
MKITLRHAYPGDEPAPYESRRLRPEEEVALAEIREILMRELSSANSRRHAAIGVPQSRRRARVPVSNRELRHLDAVDDVVPGEIVASLPVQFASAPPTTVIDVVNGSPDSSQVGNITPQPTTQGSPARQLPERNFAMRFCGLVCLLMLVVTLGSIAVYAFITLRDKKGHQGTASKTVQWSERHCRI